MLAAKRIIDNLELEKWYFVFRLSLVMTMHPQTLSKMHIVPRGKANDDEKTGHME
jgi:hypothetical protein